ERPVDSVMRLSRSMCGQPSCRATNPPAVDLPLPMNPVRQMRRRGRTSLIIDYLSDLFQFDDSNAKRGPCRCGKLIALQNVDCTIEGGKLDLGAAGVERAEQAVAKSRIEMLRVVGRRQLR